MTTGSQADHSPDRPSPITVSTTTTGTNTVRVDSTRPSRSSTPRTPELACNQIALPS